MTLRSLAGTSAIVLSLTSTGLLADVTPEEVWQAWQDSSAAMGTTVTAESAARDGDTLVVSKIAMNDSTGGTATLDTIAFTDNGDGTVSVVLPDSFPINLTIPATEGDATSTPSDLAIAVTMPGATITASGTPDSIAYASDAPQLDLTFDITDSAGTGSTATVEMKLTGVQAHSSVASGEAESYQEDLTVKSVVISAKGADAISNFTLGASIANLTTNVMVSVPKGTGADAFEVALAKGLTMSSQFGMGTTTLDVTTTEAGATTTIGVGLQDGVVNMSVDAGKVDYYNNFNALSVNIASPDVPMPNAAMGLGQAELHLMFPMLKSDTPADFAFLFNLTDLSFAEDIWAMIDPGQAFKHDPATVIVDATGKITLSQDLTADTAAMTVGDPNAVGALNALEVPNITLKAGGAELTAQGGFTFDHSDMTTFAGVPAPTGKLDVKATGLNALIDTLVAMGLVPQDQADQGRMMLAIFANTATDADEMTSTLEFKDKHFFANGQQLQ